jgi:hypothetical protein
LDISPSGSPLLAMRLSTQRDPYVMIISP